MDHEIYHLSAIGEVSARCLCGWSTDFIEEHLAHEAGDRHLLDAKALKLNAGPKPSLKSLAEYYRKQSLSEGNSAADRRLWAALADEMDQAVLRRTDEPIEGQIELF